MGEGQSGDELQLVQVFSSQGHLQANVIKSKLDAAGIPALLSYESVGRVFGLTADGIGEVRVMVPESRATEAIALINDDDPLSDDTALPFDPESSSV